MTTFFTSDHHFGHKNIIDHTGRPFGSVRDMDDEMVRRWNSVVRGNDTVYYIGDFGLSSPGYLAGILGKLKGTIHLIKGNHDKKGTALNPKCRDRFESIGDVKQIYVNDKKAPRGKQHIFMFHYSCDTWNKKHWSTWLLYGHSHGKGRDRPDELALDMSVEAWDYTPVSYEQVRQVMARKTWKQPFKARGKNL
jgi:calcineurin-like phosphoesterase family protein